jgi:hypothetical protein
LPKKKGDLDEEINFLKLSHEDCYNSNLTFNKQSDFYYKNIISNNFNKIIFNNKAESIARF